MLDSKVASKATSIASLAMIAPLLVGSAIALSTAAENLRADAVLQGKDHASGSLRSTQIKPMNLAALPEGAFGDRD